MCVVNVGIGGTRPNGCEGDDQGDHKKPSLILTFHSTCMPHRMRKLDFPCVDVASRRDARDPKVLAITVEASSSDSYRDWALTEARELLLRSEAPESPMIFVPLASILELLLLRLSADEGRFLGSPCLNLDGSKNSSLSL
jgi:hypothetical protein